MTFPGFIDVHVHFRDPGVPGAETTASGLAAAAAGGFAAVVTMPNTSPACDSPEALDYQRRAAAAAGSPVRLFPAAAITKGRAGKEVADLEALAEAGAAFFTDDGAFVEDDRVMAEAMARAAELNICVCDHAMRWKDRSPGVIRDCPLARRLNLPVIPVSVETEAIRRDLSICRDTGCRLHIQHISTAEGVGLIREARAEGLPVTAEATPHHLAFCCEEISADDASYKMAPPLGSREDRAELRRAVREGLLMVATDHAPHPSATKDLGFAGSANGITGLEAALPVTYHVMVTEEGMEVGAWARAWSELPASILSKWCGFDPAALRPVTIETCEPRRLDTSGWKTLSRNSPYDGYPAEITVVAG